MIRIYLPDHEGEEINVEDITADIYEERDFWKYLAESFYDGLGPADSEILEEVLAEWYTTR